MIRIKICGITDVEDALAAAAAGADLLGFVFAPSPRRVDPGVVARISRRLPAGVERVGVFVDEDPRRIREIVAFAGLTMVQLHGEEAVAVEEDLAAAGLRVIKALRVTGLEEALRRAAERSVIDLLIEPRVAGVAGGAGRVLDPELAAGIVEGLPDRHVYLAGGLGPDNAAETLRRVRPWGVDASSRLERAPGRKDPGLMRRFVEVVRA